MNIQKAKALKPGDIVQCPEDRGNPAYVARVTHAGGPVYKNIHGTEYIWVSVRPSLRTIGGGVWPSNRLGAL